MAGSSMQWRINLSLVAWLSIVGSGLAQIMSVDLGHEFFKVALMRQGVPLEIVLNSHSKRKTSTAVSYFESIRIFGDDALAHQGKAPAKVPMFFHSLLGRNFTAEDIKPDGSWWKQFGLGDKFYAYNLGYNEARGAPNFVFSENATEGEEVLAAVLQFARKMSETESDGKPVRDLVVTMPSDATLRQRQAIVAAGEIAGCRVLTLVHEGSAYAVQRAVDFMPEKNSTELILFYNLGSRKAEVTVAKFESRSAGMVAGKMAPVVTILGSAIDFNIGGHLFDLKIADAMLKKFQEKFPKLADGIVQNPRALRKLLAQSQKTKMILSSNKNAPFIVESLYEDTDFQTTIKREDFEEMCKEMFSHLTDPIHKALGVANVTMPEINQVEVVGGAWRVPKVQQLLSDFIEKAAEKKIPLGQHLNGEEAGALGAALVAANSSSSFRVKKIFFSDITMHEYAVQVVSLKGEWQKNLTKLYPVGTPLGGKKKLAFSLEEDFEILVFEDGVLLSRYTVTGLADVLEGKWKEFNLTGIPKISVTVPLETSGMLEIKNPTATVEELYWINVTREKAKPKANGTNASNTTEEAAPADEANASQPEAEAEAEAEAETLNASDANATGNTSNTSNTTEEVEYETIQKQKKKKHETKLKVTRVDMLPIALTDAEISDAKARLEEIDTREAEVLAVAGIKNELEAAIYGSRDKLEREDIVKVSTEEQREELMKICTEYEEWMYESGATKSDYETRLANLQNLLGPMEERALELESRADLPDTVKEGIEEMKKTHAHIEKEMPWVNANKTSDALTKLTEFEEWWNKKHESQASLPLHEAPAYTKLEVTSKMNKVNKELDKLKKTKKPKDKPQKKNQTNSSKAASADDKQAEDVKLPSDPAEVEKEIAKVRDQKSAAVENEDFDKAQALKQQEQVLIKHLETLQANQQTEL